VGGIAWKPGVRVYLDTNLFIYAVEEIVPFAEQIHPLFQAADQGEIVLVTSLLALAETLVMPYRREDELLVTTYRDLFTHPPSGLLVAPLNATILEQAAKLRADNTSLRLPDAIHLATAQSARCDMFLTNDKRLRAVSSPVVTILAEAT
jgi:predicted nucleic acid-binding protein